MAIMAARPGGWIPSPRLCFAFVLRLPSFGDAGEGVFFLVSRSCVDRVCC